jgi:hypothetical protein
MKRTLVMLSSVLALAILALNFVLSAEAQQGRDKPSQDAVERTRKTVRMLDDVYKTAVVLITDKYVNEEDDYPAGSAAIDLFTAISEKGWHDARLIDLTGEPYDPKNVARDEFEKEGGRQFKAGKDYFEQVVEKDGKHYLRAMTPVPVVMQKCAMCHPHYKDAKEGEAIGAVSYTLPIE